MKPILVTVKEHHLRGNSFIHGERNHNHCPLWEALQEAGYKVWRVGQTCIDIKGDMYDIDTSLWNRSTVEEFISRADRGEEISVPLILEPSVVETF